MADTGFSSGGGQIGREAPENFFVPPWAPQGGDRGGTVPPLKLHSPKILHHLLNEFTRKYQEKNLCPPPESLRGGTFWLSPPWIAQAGDNSQGGDSPPPEIAQGGDSPLVPPLYPLLYIYVHKLPWPKKPWKSHVACLELTVKWKTVLYCILWYKIVQYCSVHKSKRHFKCRNEFLDLKNHGKDM